MSSKSKQLIEKARKEIETNTEKVQQDPFRLSYHLMPPVGLLNDPNGLIHYHGRYHLFYQWNPFATNHGSKFWGHFSSADLVHWQGEPIALTPSEVYDKNGCYSGSAIEHEGKMYVFYTGNVKDEAGHRKTYQCLAVSKDGIHFDKKGPIIDLPDGFTAHFRDPKVWKQNDKWYMIIGAQDENRDGCVVVYTSTDLLKWQYQDVIAGSNRHPLGNFGYMWECPDFFRLEGKDILLVCPQGLEAKGIYYHNLFQSGYFCGEFNERKSEYKHGDFHELDRGFDFYAPQTTLDEKGRRLLFAWMGITDEREPHHPTIPYNWVHGMTLPRELYMKNNRLCQRPVEELKFLRQDEVAYKEVCIKNETKALEKVRGKTIELVIENIVSDSLEEITIQFRDHASLTYNVSEKKLIFKRKSLIKQGMEERVCMLDSLETLHIFLDTSSIEVFANEGEEVFTARIFPEYQNEDIRFIADGRVQFDLKKWDLTGVEVNHFGI